MGSHRRGPVEVSGTGSLKNSFRNVNLQHKSMKGKEFSGLPIKGSLELENLISPSGPLASLLLGKGEMDETQYRTAFFRDF